MDRKFSRLLLGVLILVLVGGYAVQSTSACIYKKLTITVTTYGGTNGGDVQHSPEWTCSPLWGCGWYKKGTKVTLTATPNTGYRFLKWAGDASSCGSSTTCTITMCSHKNVKAIFVKQYKLTVNIKDKNNPSVTPSCKVEATWDSPYPGGDGSADLGNGGSKKIDTESWVTLTPKTCSGYRFVKWAGDASSCGSSTMCSIKMTSDKTVTAVFVKQYDLTVNVNPTGGGTTSPSVGTHKYDEGTVVTVTATPNSNFRFDHWSGDCSGSGSCSVTMDSDKTVTANFVEQVTLTVSVDPSSSGNYVDVYKGSSYIASVSASSSFTFDKGDSVKLVANPTSDYHFDEWSGVSCSGTTCTFTINSDTSVTANFVELHDLTVEVKDQSGSSIGCKITLNPPNSQYGDGDKETYEDGDSVTATAPSTCTSGGKDYRFYQWEGDCSGSSCSVTMDSDKTVRAKYVEQNDLTVYVKDIHGTALTSCKVQASWTSSYTGGSGSADLGNGGSKKIDTGSSVTLTPKTCSGYRFDHWEGDCSGSSCSFTSMTSDKTVTAVFVKQYDLTVNVNPTGGGTTSPSEGTHVYDDGTSVTVTATPNTGYRFDHWSGDCTGSGSCSVTMNSDKTVTANFVKIWTLEVIVEPTGAGTTQSRRAPTYTTMGLI